MRQAVGLSWFMRIIFPGNRGITGGAVLLLRILSLTSALLGLVVAAPLAAEEALFPFVVAYDRPDNAGNIAGWLPKPAGAQGFVRVENGRFVNDAGPIRFLGTNLCFDACFPTHEQADRLARRLASFGVNVVRMHHMDSHSIWGKSPNRLTIDPERLERLDYLVWRLKEEGVYTNLNLHVSRSLGPKEGFPFPDQRPNYDKGLDNFEPRMIELQKKYARDLLTHVNPYTRTAYTQEPAIAFVEINNENALFHEWSGGGLDDLPDPYASTFREQWNAWLRKKYGTTAKLRQAWRQGEQPLGEELLANGNFSKPLEGSWSLERDNEEHATWSVEPGNAGKRFLRLVVRRPGSVSWRPQFSHAGIALKQGQAYTLTFAIRSEPRRELFVNCMMAHDPWENLGLGANVRAETEFRRERLTFIAERDDPNARITFTSLQAGVYELAEVSLRPGGVTGLTADERLEDNTVAVMQHSRRNRSAPARKDFIDFLWDTERDYWQGMYHYLKDELGVRAPISGTQLSWSPVHVQAGLDYIDAHSYWQHPHFPGRPWDPRNWYVRNVAMVNAPGGTLVELAGRRVAGLPFTVSEYNHPTPNAYAAEGLPMLAAMAGFQSWDAIYSFAWSHDDDFEPRRMHGYFDIEAEPTRLVHHPACAALFLRGDMPPAQTTTLVPLPAKKERAVLHATGSPWTLTAQHLGAPKNLPLLHGVALDPQGAVQRSSAWPEVSADQKALTSDNQALRWDATRPEQGVFVADTPRTKLFTGFVGERVVSLGKVQLRFGETRLGWATVSLTCLDGAGFDRPGRILVAATGWRQNTDWNWQELEEDGVTLGIQWGRDPVLCEGVPVRITLPVAASRVECHALDEAGARAASVPLAHASNPAQLSLGPQYKTLWYEIVIK